MESEYLWILANQIRRITFEEKRCSAIKLYLCFLRIIKKYKHQSEITSLNITYRTAYRSFGTFYEVNNNSIKHEDTNDHHLFENEMFSKSKKLKRR